MSAADPVAAEGIRQYINHFMDRAYVQEIFAASGSEVLLATLATMMRGQGRAENNDASLFLEDALLYRYAPKEFRQAFDHSAVLTALRQNLYDVDYFVRHRSIHTLGRLGPVSNRRLLNTALPWYVAHDPLNLDGLLVEMAWLNGLASDHRSQKTRIGQLIVAPLWVTRWAAVEILWDRHVFADSWERRRGPSWARQYLRLLGDDRHPRVRTEAR